MLQKAYNMFQAGPATVRYSFFGEENLEILNVC